MHHIPKLNEETNLGRSAVCRELALRLLFPIPSYMMSVFNSVLLLRIFEDNQYQLTNMSDQHNHTQNRSPFQVKFSLLIWTQAGTLCPRCSA